MKSLVVGAMLLRSMNAQAVAPADTPAVSATPVAAPVASASVAPLLVPGIDAPSEAELLGPARLNTAVLSAPSPDLPKGTADVVLDQATSAVPFGAGSTSGTGISFGPAGWSDTDADVTPALPTRSAISPPVVVRPQQVSLPPAVQSIVDNIPKPSSTSAGFGALAVSEPVVDPAADPAAATPTLDATPVDTTPVDATPIAAPVDVLPSDVVPIVVSSSALVDADPVETTPASTTSSALVDADPVQTTPASTTSLAVVTPTVLPIGAALPIGINPILDPNSPYYNPIYDPNSPYYNPNSIYDPTSSYYDPNSIYDPTSPYYDPSATPPGWEGDDNGIYDGEDDDAYQGSQQGGQQGGQRAEEPPVYEEDDDEEECPAWCLPEDDESPSYPSSTPDSEYAPYKPSPTPEYPAYSSEAEPYQAYEPTPEYTPYPKQYPTPSYAADPYPAPTPDEYPTPSYTADPYAVEPSPYDPGNNEYPTPSNQGDSYAAEPTPYDPGNNDYPPTEPQNSAEPQYYPEPTDNSYPQLKKVRSILRAVRRQVFNYPQPSDDDDSGDYDAEDGSIPDWLYDISGAPQKPTPTPKAPKKCPKSCYKPKTTDYGYATKPARPTDYGYGTKPARPTYTKTRKGGYKPTDDSYQTTEQPYYPSPTSDAGHYGVESADAPYPDHSSSALYPQGNTTAPLWPTGPANGPDFPSSIPYESTYVPDESTQAPYEPTSVPDEPTQAPYEPTPVPDESTQAPYEPTTLVTQYQPQPSPEQTGYAGSDSGSPAGDYTGDTLDTVCPSTCNPFNPAENFCDVTTGCATTGGSKYYCACRAGFRADNYNAKDFSKQFKVAGQPYVYLAVSTSCNTPCSDQTCSEVLERSQCK